MDDKLKDLLEIQNKRRRDFEQRKVGRWKKSTTLPHPVAHVLDYVFGSVPQGRRKLEERKLQNAWPSYLGAAAKYCVGVRITRNTLYVRITDPLWRQELIFLKSELLARCQKEFPALKLQDIFFTG